MATNQLDRVIHTMNWPRYSGETSRRYGSRSGKSHNRTSFRPWWTVAKTINSAPAWVNQYVGALCSADAAFIVERTDAALGVTEQDIVAQFQRMHENGLDCTSFRYLGSVGDRQFVFVLRHGPKDVWYVFTLSEDGQTIAKVE